VVNCSLVIAAGAVPASCWPFTLTTPDATAAAAAAAAAAAGAAWDASYAELACFAAGRRERAAFDGLPLDTLFDVSNARLVRASSWCGWQHGC
jgi:hypothetical protein